MLFWFRATDGQKEMTYITSSVLKCQGLSRYLQRLVKSLDTEVNSENPVENEYFPVIFIKTFTLEVLRLWE